MSLPGHNKQATAQEAANTETRELEICPSCGLDFVYPVDWATAGQNHWEVDLLCPNCEWTGSGVFGQDAVDRFDEVLDRGSRALVSDLESLTRANMEEQIERFAAALQAGLILPEDF